MIATLNVPNCRRQGLGCKACTGRLRGVCNQGLYKALTRTASGKYAGGPNKQRHLLQEISGSIVIKPNSEELRVYDRVPNSAETLVRVLMLKGEGLKGFGSPNRRRSLKPLAFFQGIREWILEYTTVYLDLLGITKTGCKVTVLFNESGLGIDDSVGLGLQPS